LGARYAEEEGAGAYFFVVEVYAGEGEGWHFGGFKGRLMDVVSLWDMRLISFDCED
jgi:hypothetical protein